MHGMHSESCLKHSLIVNFNYTNQIKYKDTHYNQ